MSSHLEGRLLVVVRFWVAAQDFACFDLQVRNGTGAQRVRVLLADESSKNPGAVRKYKRDATSV